MKMLGFGQRKLCLTAPGMKRHPQVEIPGSLPLQQLGTNFPVSPNKLRLQAKQAVLSQRQEERRTDGKIMFCFSPSTFSTYFFLL